MGIGVSIFLLAIGAILAFAVDVSTQGFDLNAVGVILMIVGAIGLATSFLFWDNLGFGGYTRRRTAVDVRDHYVDDGVVDVVDAPAERDVVVTSAPRVTGTVRERRVVRRDTY